MHLTITVLVTSVGGHGVGSQILATLRSSNINIIIIGVDAFDYFVHKESLDFFYKVPLPGKLDYEVIITSILKKHNVNMIFAGSYNEMLFFSQRRKKYSENGIQIYLNNEYLTRICNNKLKIFTHLQRLGVNIPHFVAIKKISDYKKIEWFPVVIKPNIDAIGSKNVYIATDRAEALLVIKKMLDRNIDIIAQKYVGNSNTEYTIGVTSYDDCTIAGTAIIHRNFSSPISYKDKFLHGSTCYAISSGITFGKLLHNENISMQAKEIATLLNSNGPLNIQAMYTNSHIQIFDIHPSLTGSVYIKSLGGYNEPIWFIERNFFKKDIELTYNDLNFVRDITPYILRVKND